MIFSGCSLIGRSHPVEPFSFTGTRGISDGFCFGANSGYYARLLCFYTIQLLYGRFFFISIPSPFNPFPCFLLQEQRWWSFLRRQGNCTNAMLASPQSSFGRVVKPSCGACRHHTPFRRRDIQEGLQNGQGCSLFSEDEPCSSPLGSHPWPSCLTRAYGLFLQVSSSLAPIQYTGVCCIAQQPNRGWLLGFGKEVFFPRHTCSVERAEYLMELLLDYIYLYMLLLCYIAIYLYIYIGIITAVPFRNHRA